MPNKTMPVPNLTRKNGKLGRKPSANPKSGYTVNLSQADILRIADGCKDHNQDNGGETKPAEYARLCLRSGMKLRELVRDGEIKSYVLDKINAALAEQEELLS